jgi:hypothetical protein
VPPAGAPAQPAALRVIDLRSMKRLMNVRLGPDPRIVGGQLNPVAIVAWLTPTRILLVYGRGGGDAQLLVVDTTGRRIVRRTPIAGEILDHERTARELLLLLGERGTIAAPRLVSVDATGAQGAVTLGGIRAGWTTSGEGSDIVSHSVSPGLAVDRASRTAYLVSPSGTVAAVALDTLSVSYRTVIGRYAKLWDGASRQATVVRPGVLAVAGTDSTIAVDSVRGRYSVSTPTGLELLDTTSAPWTRTVLNRQATWVGAWNGNVLVTGWWWHPEREEQLGMGLALYRADGTERFRVLEGHAVHVVGVFLGRAYVYTGGNGERALVDLANGEIRGRRLGNHPWLLLEPRGGT